MSSIPWTWHAGVWICPKSLGASRTPESGPFAEFETNLGRHPIVLPTLYKVPCRYRYLNRLSMFERKAPQYPKLRGKAAEIKYLGQVSQQCFGGTSSDCPLIENELGERRNADSSKRPSCPPFRGRRQIWRNMSWHAAFAEQHCWTFYNWAPFQFNSEGTLPTAYCLTGTFHQS